MYSYIDMHCDSLLRTLLQGGESLYDGEGMLNIKKLSEARQLCQFFAIFFPPREMTGKEGTPPLPPDEEFFERLRNTLYEQVAAHSEVINMARNYQEIMANQSAEKASAVLTVEDGRLVNGRMEALREMYEKGVRAIALTWNFANCFGYPNSKDPEVMKLGLTDFGKEAIGEMNRLGILIDVSHLSDGGFYDVAHLSDKPFIASHSNCRAVTAHPRNLTDDMIRLLARKGGVAGLNLCPDFVYQGSGTVESRVEDLTAHVLHLMNVGGEDCVGIGTDFDGIRGCLEVDCPAKMELLFDALSQKGVTARQLEKMASGNVLRVIKESMK